MFLCNNFFPCPPLLSLAILGRMFLLMSQLPEAVRPDEDPSVRALALVEGMRARYQAELEEVRAGVDDEGISDKRAAFLDQRERWLEDWLSCMTEWNEHLQTFNAHDSPRSFPEFDLWARNVQEWLRERLVGLRSFYKESPVNFAEAARKGELVTGLTKELFEVIALLPEKESLVLEAVRPPSQQEDPSPLLEAFGPWSRHQLEEFVFAAVVDLDELGLLYQAVSPRERRVLQRILAGRRGS